MSLKAVCDKCDITINRKDVFYRIRYEVKKKEFIGVQKTKIISKIPVCYVDLCEKCYIAYQDNFRFNHLE